MRCLELSNFEQDFDKLTASLPVALTTAVNVSTFKEKVKSAELNKSWFDEDVKQNINTTKFRV